VSKHWAPEDFIGLEPRRRAWPAGAMVGVVLVGAACVGVAVGLYEAAGPRQPVAPEAAIEWNAVAEPPWRAAVAEDIAWQQRAAEAEAAPPAAVVRGSEAAAPSVRATFGLCKWGGGTNCVVDGDTFYIGGAKVRIAGIDAPETHDYRCASELALGDRATEKLRALLNSGAVTMTGIDRDRDVYGRLLRNVQVDGADVGAAMVSAGVAREYGGGRRGWC
jgi:endonuclease YncB( thermonuclease family)